MLYHNRGFLKSRPPNFRLDYSHPLARGLVFAGLGRHVGSTHYHDSSAYGNHGNWNTVPQMSSMLGTPSYEHTIDGDERVVVTLPSITTWTIIYKLKITGVVSFYQPILALNDTKYLIGTRYGTGYSIIIGGSYDGHLVDWGTSSDLSGERIMSFRHNGTAQRYGNNDKFMDGTDTFTYNLSNDYWLYHYQPDYQAWGGECGDVLIYDRWLSDAEVLSAYYDPVMLSGMLLPPKRRLWTAPQLSDPSPSTTQYIFLDSKINNRGIVLTK